MSKAELTLDNETVDGANMVRITLGTESILVSTGYAYQIAAAIRNTADLPAAMEHIDAVFDGWGDDGGTC